MSPNPEADRHNFGKIGAMKSDSERWDDRYRQASPPTVLTPHAVVVEAAEAMIAGNNAVDIACGWGDSGLWLASQGAVVTCLDVSAIALEHVDRRAAEMDVPVTTRQYDTARSGAPVGPWDFIACVHYLDRDMLATLWSEVGPGGTVAIAIATTTNLERHDRPSARFLLEPGELADLVIGSADDAIPVQSDETWRNNGVHEAWLIARRKP